MSPQQAPVVANSRSSSGQHWNDPGRLISVDAALERILESFVPLNPVWMPILESLGLVLAEDIVAMAAIPPFSSSAMDGFAVRSTDLRSATAEAPVSLDVIGEAAAGRVVHSRVIPGAAIRIMTGAPVPDGADAVVRFEETDEGAQALSKGRRVSIYRPANPGENIRPVGEDVAAGDVVLNRGIALRPAELGLLASVGRGDVLIHRRPRVAILATGDEIVDPGLPLSPGQIYNSNSFTIAGLTYRAGGQPVVLGVARDSTIELQAKLAESSDADLIISTGGVSVGDYDCVKDVLRLKGAIDLWEVRIKPGKPLAFGRIGNVPFLGLPGNPVAAAVAFMQFARAAIRLMLGHADLSLPTVQASLLDRVENRGGRRNYVRVRVAHEAQGQYVARLAGSQGSGVLTSLVRANGLLVIPEHLAVAEPGMVLPVQMLDWDLG